MSPNAAGLVRVLYVEDAFDQALLVRSFLTSTGRYEVVHTQDGDHAAKLLKSREWDILITDLNLPGMDGFDLIRLAREKMPDIPVLATTGYTAAHWSDEAFRAGATEVMHKPLNRDEFLNKVQELTSSGDHVPSVPTVLALGGLPGDVEMGCAGALIQARQAGKDVVIIPLCRDELDPAGAGLEAARRAAHILHARVLIDDEALDDTAQRMALVERVVRDLRPTEAYVPCMDDAHPARMDAFRIGNTATASVPTLYTYQTASTGFEFRPDRFVDIHEQMMTKMEVLAAYESEGAARVDLSPRIAQAYARYWGRFRRFSEVEPFEVLRSPS